MTTYKTLVLGATPNPTRYAYQAVKMLLRNGIEVIPVGIRKGIIEGIVIHNVPPLVEDVHTVTLYLNPTVQQNYYDYILALRPKRIVFNPGTENPAFYSILREQLPNTHIEVACTLVMLSLGHYKEAVL